MSETPSGAARYRKMMASRAPVIVDVAAPSGFVFRFQKPNAFGFIMSGALPQSAASEASLAWAEDGIGAGAGDLDSADDKTKIDVVRKIIDIRNKTLELSVDPKLVIGEAQNDGELSVSEIPDEDLSHLFKWVAAGGSTALMLSMFPE